MLVVVVAVRSSDLKQKQLVYKEKEAALEQQIEEEKARTEEIEEYRKYTQTKKYVKKKIKILSETTVFFYAGFVE